MRRPALRLSNREARWLWLSNLGLNTRDWKPANALAVIERLGYVQLDAIPNILRAHDHILWTRLTGYRPADLDRLLRRERAVFEHFTHDACVLPMTTWPWWRGQCRRLGQRVRARAEATPGYEPAEERRVLDAIDMHGPLASRDLAPASPRDRMPRAMWQRPNHKVALDVLWYEGVLGTHSRQHFHKRYDRIERIVPGELRDAEPNEAERVDWLCREALRRLGVATDSELRRFWDALSVEAVADWCARADDEHGQRVEVELVDGRWRRMLVDPDAIARRSSLAGPPASRLRVLSPFDPLTRDRERLAALFGFDFRIEIYVPKARRRYGYYVYPLLEGDRFVGRIDAGVERAIGALVVHGLWTEPRVGWTAARRARLDAELERLSRAAGLDEVVWRCRADPTPVSRT